MTRAIRAFAPAMLIVITVAAPSAAPEPTLETVLQRAGAYVGLVERGVSGIVAEERYGQQWTVLPRGVSYTGEPRHRELVSDLLIVRLDGPGLLVQFRDVFDVDGAQVRDRDERLMNLFLQPTATAGDQLERIQNESARYNIGNIERNVNTPLLAVFFLDPRNQARFGFFRTKDRKPALAAAADAARLPADAWIVRFEERAKQTVFHNTQTNADLPTHGRFWIDPETGRILMTELVAEDRSVRATIDVTFRSEPLDGMLLPLSMRERYEGRRSKSLIEGSATYDRFRQFTVNVDEKFFIKK
jgi:hypothetical protein